MSTHEEAVAALDRLRAALPEDDRKRVRLLAFPDKGVVRFAIFHTGEWRWAHVFDRPAHFPNSTSLASIQKELDKPATPPATNNPDDLTGAEHENENPPKRYVANKNYRGGNARRRR